MSNLHRYLSAARYLQGHVEAKGHVPTMQQAADALNITEASARYLFQQMRDVGLVSRRIDFGHAPAPLADVPIPHGPDGEPLYFVEVQG